MRAGGGPAFALNQGWQRAYQYDVFGNLAVQREPQPSAGGGTEFKQERPIGPPASAERLLEDNYYYSPMQRLRYLVRDEAGQHCPPELPACVPRERGLYGYGYNHAGQRVYKFFQSDIEGTETTVGYEEEEVPPPGHDVEPVSVGRRAMPNVAPIKAVTIHQRFRRFLHAPGGELLAETADGFEEDFPPIQSIYVYLYGVPVSMIRGSEVYDIYTDHLGRPQVVSQNGSARWRAHNAPFHREVLFTSIGEMNLGFPGQYYDSESNLYYNWHRYYGPSTGRYTQSDPIGLAGGINTFTYVGGDPLSSIDPFGLAEWNFSFGVSATGVVIIPTHVNLSIDVSFVGTISPSGFVLSGATASLSDSAGAYLGAGGILGLGYGEEVCPGPSDLEADYVGFAVNKGPLGGGLGLAVSPTGIGASAAFRPSCGYGAYVGSGTSRGWAYGWRWPW